MKIKVWHIRTVKCKYSLFTVSAPVVTGSVFFGYSYNFGHSVQHVSTVCVYLVYSTVLVPHRRRIYTEEKAKVVTFFGGVGENLFNSHAALAILTHNDMKKRINSTRMIRRKEWIHHILQIIQCKIASVARNWINSAPQTEWRPLPFLLYKYCTSITGCIMYIYLGQQESLSWLT